LQKSSKDDINFAVIGDNFVYNCLFTVAVPEAPVGGHETLQKLLETKVEKDGEETQMSDQPSAPSATTR